MTKLEERVNRFAQLKNGQIERHENVYFVRHDNSAALWEGARKRPSHYYRFKTETEREEWIKREKTSITKRAEMLKTIRKKKQEENAALKVGQIMYDSWGWEQTNIDWYMIVRKTGSFCMASANRGKRYRNWLRCQEIARQNPDKLIGGEPFMRRIGKYGHKGFYLIGDV